MLHVVLYESARTTLSYASLLIARGAELEGRNRVPKSGLLRLLIDVWVCGAGLKRRTKHAGASDRRGFHSRFCKP